ncbi:hypothetical protein DL766_009707 [Monosporascus sp. MC13-8B]|uniref:Beta-lactamase-related domain-containing protein n=1 Tax=Monosporascus cannonballus TaxID=155416 RepID=A0ABY0HDE8_9PEZI|nr:hypothetical protein DL762_002446 [Monosporascus cannonballus]RYO99763.1 hypothetical protein DL763_001262 [Monosporascus cannonballus]RYP14325.1 hypothetical protein DL766_009707 [Monosporascus sp. MC13-8B]
MTPEDLLSTSPPILEKLIERFGNRDASVGVMKDGTVEFLRVGSGTAMTPEETVYLISSLTKPILAVAVGVLVASGKVELETPVKDILPLGAHNGTLRVVDLLDHRSSFYGSDRLWEGHDGRVSVQNADEILGLLRTLPLNADSKGSF